MFLILLLIGLLCASAHPLQHGQRVVQVKSHNFHSPKFRNDRPLHYTKYDFSTATLSAKDELYGKCGNRVGNLLSSMLYSDMATAIYWHSERKLYLHNIPFAEEEQWDFEHDADFYLSYLHYGQIGIPIYDYSTSCVKSIVQFCDYVMGDSFFRGRLYFDFDWSQDIPSVFLLLSRHCPYEIHRIKYANLHLLDVKNMVAFDTESIRYAHGEDIDLLHNFFKHQAANLNMLSFNDEIYSNAFLSSLPEQQISVSLFEVGLDQNESLSKYLTQQTILESLTLFLLKDLPKLKLKTARTLKSLYFAYYNGSHVQNEYLKQFVNLTDFTIVFDRASSDYTDEFMLHSVPQNLKSLSVYSRDYVKSKQICKMPYLKLLTVDLFNIGGPLPESLESLNIAHSLVFETDAAFDEMRRSNIKYFNLSFDDDATEFDVVSTFENLPSKLEFLIVELPDYISQPHYVGRTVDFKKLENLKYIRLFYFIHLMPEIIDFLKSLSNLKFLEVIGSSDFSIFRPLCLERGISCTIEGWRI